jgi:hypothetical protein
MRLGLQLEYTCLSKLNEFFLFSPLPEQAINVDGVTYYRRAPYYYNKGYQLLAFRTLRNTEEKVL